MSEFVPKILAFGGVDNGGSDASIGQAFLATVTNFEFLPNGDKMALRTRPGTVRKTGFSKRGYDTTGGVPKVSDSAVADLATTGYTAPAMARARIGMGERPLLLTRGRAFTYESPPLQSTPRWEDRLGVLQTRVDIVGRLRSGLFPTFAVPSQPAATWDFGAGQGTAFTGTLSRINSQGDVETSSSVTTDLRDGNGCVTNRAGAYISTTASVDTGNNLILTGHPLGSPNFTQVIVAADARAPTGFGDVPCVSCDYDAQVIFVAYWTTTANTAKVLQLNASSYAINATATVAFGAATPTCIWVTNSSVVNDRVIVALVDSTNNNVFTRVYNFALVNQAIDRNIPLDSTGTADGRTWGVVLGVAESGQVYGANTFHNGAGGEDGLRIWTRSTSAATHTIFNQWFGAPMVVGGTGNQNARTIWWIKHQPIKVGGRVLLGIATPGSTAGTGIATAGTLGVSCIWYSVDITDLNVSGTTTGSLRDPVIVARGDGAAPSFSPRAATLDPSGSAVYRFPNSSWGDFALQGTAPNFYPGGSNATLEIVQVTLEAQGVAHHRGSTVIAGNVPRLFSGASLTPVGFPFMGGPSIVTGVAAGGSLTAGASYTVIGCWAFTDSAGQVHRSEPSLASTVTPAGPNLTITAALTGPLWNERDVGTVWAEFYCTTANPTGSAAHFLVSRVSAGAGVTASTISTSWGSIDQSQPALYTDGNIFPNRVVAADGGIALVGDRCWVSDGRTVVASRLGAPGANEAPSWNDDGPLVLDLPAAAGRIVALGSIDDKLIILATGGVWVSDGQGPDDAGTGGDFRVPVKISDVGCSGPRLVASVSGRGVYYLSANTGAWPNAQVGGVMLVDRSLAVAQVSGRIANPPTSENLAGATDFVHIPETDQLFIAFPPNRYYLYDLRHDAWGVWFHSAFDWPTSSAAVNGQLWGCGTEPMVFSAYTGQDTAGGTSNFEQDVGTSKLNVGDSPFHRGRVRSADLLFDTPSDGVSITCAAWLDGQPTAVTAVGIRAAPPDGWPGWLGPRFVLKHQKCSVIQFSFSLDSGYNTLVGLSLLVKLLRDTPAAGRTPLV